MNKRKLMLVAVALCMAAILLAGGTLAYLTDTETKTNVMVIGNVEINIDELCYVDGEFKPFKDNEFTLYPLDEAQGNVLYNKIVYTANTSKVNPLDADSGKAYIRNIILFEANTKLGYTRTADCCFNGLHFAYDNNSNNYTGSDGKKYHVASQPTVLDETVTINDVEYWVAIFTEIDKQPIESDAALSTLNSVYVDKDVTSEQMLGWGDNLDILVFSQGIQAEGLEHDEAMSILGEVNETNLQTWLASAENATINDWTTKGQSAN